MKKDIEQIIKDLKKSLTLLDQASGIFGDTIVNLPSDKKTKKKFNILTRRFMNFMEKRSSLQMMYMI